jgi:hypothetical protein
MEDDFVRLRLNYVSLARYSGDEEGFPLIVMGTVGIEVGRAPKHYVTDARVGDHIDPIWKEFLAVESQVDSLGFEIFFSG